MTFFYGGSMVQLHNTIVETAIDSSGNVISGAKLFIYEAGTTTKLTTYSDSALTTPNANPLVADSAGRFTTVYGNPDDYKFVLAPANDTDPPTSAIVTTDNYTIAATTSLSGGINSSGETEHLINAQTGTSYTILDGDRANLVTHSNASAIAVTLPQATSSTFEAGWYYETFVTGAGTVTITPATSTINGLATLTLPANSGCKIVSDGTNYQIEGLFGINPGVNAQTGTTYTIAADDLNKLVTTSNASAIAVTLPQANTTTFKSGWKMTLSNLGAGLLTLTPTTSTIDGDATLTLTAGQSVVINSDGTNYFSSLGSTGAETLLETQTASTSSSIDFTSNIDSSFTNYRLSWTDLVPATDGTILRVRISIASSFKSGASDYAWASLGIRSGAASAVATVDAADAQIQITPTNGIGSGTGESGSGQLILSNPSGTALHKYIRFSSSQQASDATVNSENGTGSYLTGVEAIDGLQFIMASGNIVSGTFKLYGIS